MKTYILLFACVFTLMTPSFSNASEKAVELKTAWMGENEAFPVWYARQRGWDRENGITVSMLHFPSGTEIVRGVLAYDWAVAGCGAVPALTAALSDRLSIIAVANDESFANEIFVRTNSGILSAKRAGPDFPQVLGNAQAVKGKLVLCPRGTSAHYLLDAWLRVLGLNEKDVRIQDMPPEKALGAFSGGLGDAVALWAPQTFQAAQKGLVPVASGSACGIEQPVLIVGNASFAKENPKLVEFFLKLYFRAVKEIRERDPKELAAEYQRFLDEWAGVVITADEALRDLQNHKLFTLDENLRLFSSRDGASEIGSWLGKIVSFCEKEGVLKNWDFEGLRGLTDAYLKAAAGSGK